MLSLILPTFNEAANIRRLIPGLEKSLAGVLHEIIIVDDDSPDGTWKVAEELAKQHPSVRVLRRVGRRGLSSAVVEGFDLAKGDTLLVMDSDGQHDASLVLSLAKAIRDGATIAVASRYTSGGSTGGWGGMRLFMSKAATLLARKLPPVEVSDPMSGFFALDAKAYRSIAAKLHPRGFKILLEVLAHLPAGTRTAEVPMTFGLRTAGQSKMSLKVQVAFLLQMAGIVSVRLRLPWLLFWAACLAIGLSLLLRVWPLRDLYLNPTVRSQVAHVLPRVAQEHGWLVSDLAVQEARPGYMRVLHREHGRGDDPESCLEFMLPSADPAPCAN